MNLEDYLREVSSILKEDYPSDFQEILNLIASDTSLIGIDDKRTVVSVEDGQICFSNPEVSRVFGLESLITKSLMFKLLDGEVTLADSILDPEFALRGNPDAILRFFKMMEIVLRISQRSARLIDLLNRFRYE